MNRFETIRRGYIRLLETLEEMALATVARIVPWLIPIAPAWAIKTSVETYLHVDPVIALLMALAFEGMGIYVSHVTFLSWTWNKSRNKTDPVAPFPLMVALVSVYLIVGGILVLLIKIYPPATVFAPAAFLPLGLVVYTAWATHMELSTWRSGKEDEALERKVRSGLKAEIKALTTERDNLTTECDTLTLERDTLTTERDTLSTECNTLRVQVDTLTQDCNTLSTTRTELLTEVNSLAQQLDTRLHDLDTQAYSPDNGSLQPTALPGYNPANGPLQQACTTLQPDQPRLTRFSLPTSQGPSISDQLARVTGTLSTTPDQPNQADDERDVTARETRLDTIVNLLHTNPHLTLSALAEKLTISRTTLYRDLNTLQERGLLSTTKAGTPQNGHSWTVVP